MASKSLSERIYLWPAKKPEYVFIEVINDRLDDIYHVRTYLLLDTYYRSGIIDNLEYALAFNLLKQVALDKRP